MSDNKEKASPKLALPTQNSSDSTLAKGSETNSAKNSNNNNSNNSNNNNSSSSSNNNNNSSTPTKQSAETPTDTEKKKDSTANSSKAKAKEQHQSGIVLTPAMVMQMHKIINNHRTLKREADNNVPFTNHMLDLSPVPEEFLEPLPDNSAATAYIKAEAGKIRSHLSVVRPIKDMLTDPDAKSRIEREIEALDAHIVQVNDFMRMSFHSALSGNPAAQASSFAKDPSLFKKPSISAAKTTSAAHAKTKPATGTPGTSTPKSVVHTPPVSNPNTTHVPLSSALAHVATQSTRQSGPVDLDGGSRILSKRKIQELVSEIDPTERLEPEVEDILCDIADEFIESVTSFACQLAKHRKSDTLEAKDLQIHLERNWNIRIPGFASEEIRSVRKVTVPPAHQEKLSAITNMKNMRRFNQN